MAKIDDGGPAFPTVARDGNWQPHHDGMSLRDWFAGQAMVGLLPLLPKMNERTGNEDTLATAFYELADAMLRARAAQSPEISYEQAAGRGDRQSPAERQADHLREFGK